MTLMGTALVAIDTPVSAIILCGLKVLTNRNAYVVLTLVKMLKTLVRRLLISPTHASHLSGDEVLMVDRKPVTKILHVCAVAKAG